MNPSELLLKEFDRLVEAPDAMLRLRKFVLDLAVRGRLQQSLTSDEPAGELLRRIEAGLAERRKGRRRTLPAVSEDEVPHAVPANWVWTRLRHVTHDHGQVVPSTEFTYIDVSAIDKEAGRIVAPTVLAPEDAPSRARKITKPGDVLYSCVRPYLLNVAVLDGDISPPPIASTAFAILDGMGLIVPGYLWLALRSPYFVAQVEAAMRGQAYPAINDSDLAVLPIPLPPLAEQHRIVAKVDELMALCDQLEAGQKEREARRDELRSTSLLRLTADDGDVTQGKADVRFFLERSDHVITHPEDIGGLRQAILDLAVQGRLVRQDPSDEPGSSSLNASSQRLPLPKPFRASETVRRAAGNGQKEGVPTGWESVLLSDIAPVVTSGSRGWAKYYASRGAVLVRSQNVKYGRLDLRDLAYVTPPRRAEGTRTAVIPGDLLVVITGDIGHVAVWERGLGEAYVSQHVALVRPFSPELSSWLLLCLLAPGAGRGQLLRSVYGGKPGLNLNNLRTVRLPLPPVTEQRRIAAEVRQLTRVCDDLQEALVRGETNQAKLLKATLRDGVVPGPMAAAIGEYSGVQAMLPTGPSSTGTGNVGQARSRAPLGDTDPSKAH